MPKVARGEAEIHWQERGSGPLVVASIACSSYPEVFHALLDELARDHRVVTYDPRGFGQSTPGGPFDVETDADDLEALLDELGGDAVVVSTGDGCNRAVRVAARRPELVRAVVTPGGNPLGRSISAESEALVASDSVLNVLLELLRTDYRAALRMALGAANPQLDEDGLRERVDVMVEYAPQDAVLERVSHWIEDAAREEALAIGPKLVMLEHPNNPWFPVELAERTREQLPEARIEIVSDGAVSRPDYTAAAVRGFTR